MEGRTWPGGAGEEELPLGNQLEGKPIHWGWEEGPRDRAVLGGGGWSTQHSWCPWFPGVLRTDPSGHAWWDRSFLRCDSGAGLGCLPQDGAPGTVASSFASPRHLRSLENQTGVSPYPPLSPCHPQDRLRPVLLERWGHRETSSHPGGVSSGVSGVSAGEGLRHGEARTARSGRKPRGGPWVGPHWEVRDLTEPQEETAHCWEQVHRTCRVSPEFLPAVCPGPGGRSLGPMSSAAGPVFVSTERSPDRLLTFSPVFIRPFPYR